MQREVESEDKEYSAKRRESFDAQLYFCDCIRMGDLEKVRKLQQNKQFCDKLKEWSVLSSNPVRNIRYHVISSIAAVSLTCMEGGMPAETAHCLGDSYIRQTDLINDIEELHRLNRRMVLEFTKQMMDIRKQRVYSKNIVQCIDYIYAHIGDRITVAELADYCSLNPNYLSRLFREEVGTGMSEYIRSAKVESAKNMLRFSEDSYLTIANNLAFSSQSHFVKVFREHTNMTPKEYRDRFYGKGLRETNV